MSIAVFVMFKVVIGVSQQYNINSKTAIFFVEVVVFTYLGLAVAPATWYNLLNVKKI